MGLGAQLWRRRPLPSCCHGIRFCSYDWVSVGLKLKIGLYAIWYTFPTPPTKSELASKRNVYLRWDWWVRAGAHLRLSFILQRPRCGYESAALQFLKEVEAVRTSGNLPVRKRLKHKWRICQYYWGHLHAVFRICKSPGQDLVWVPRSAWLTRAQGSWPFQVRCFSRATCGQFDSGWSASER